MYKKIKAPEQLCNKSMVPSMESTTKHLLECVANLNQFLRDCHAEYLTFSKELQRLCIALEAKVERTGSTLTASVLEFGKTVQGLGIGLEKQASKNIVGLKTIKTEKDQTLFGAFVEKIRKMDSRTDRYSENSQLFGQLETSYLKKASEFANIQTDAVKCYQAKYFARRFAKVSEAQTKLQALLEHLKTQQSDLQLLGREARRLLNQLIGLELRKIHDMNRLARQIVGKLAFGDKIIIEQDECTVASELFPPPSDRAIEQICINHLAKLRRSFQADHFARQELGVFVKGTLGLMRQHCKSLSDRHKDSSYLSSEKNRWSIQESLGQRVSQEFSEAFGETFRYCQVIERLAKRLDRCRTFQQYINFQKANFEEYEKHFRQILELKLDAATRHRELKLLNDHFLSKDEFFNQKFRQQLRSVLDSSEQILKSNQAEYTSQCPRSNQITQPDIRRVYENQMFSMLINPFLTGSADFSFIPSKHIEAYVRLRAQQMENVPLQLEPQEPKPKRLVKWCGLARSTSQEIIDQYNCALTYGILLQGKLYLQRRNLKFVSLFNRSTFIGKTQIEIPSNDILRIEGEHSALNYYIIIATIHGEIRFTSFLSSPLALLKDLYSKRSSSNIQTNISHQQAKDLYDRAISQLSQIHGFKCVRPDCFNKQVSVNCVCTVMLEHTINTMFMSVLYKFQNNPGLFENYSVRIIKPQLSKELFRCEVEHCGEFQTMKEHFLQITRGLLEPYQANFQILAKEKSCSLQLSAIQTKEHVVIISTPPSSQTQIQPPKTSRTILSTNNVTPSVDQPLPKQKDKEIDHHNNISKLRNLNQLVFASPPSTPVSAMSTKATSAKPSHIKSQISIYYVLASLVLIILFLVL